MENILEKIYASSMKFLYPMTGEETYKSIVHEAIKLVSAQFGSLILEDSDGKLVRIFSTLPQAEEVPIRENGLTREAFDKRRAFVRHKEDSKTFYRGLIKMGIKSTIYIPLSNRNKSIGVLVVNSPQDQEFSQKELDILKLFGSMASLAVRKTQLYDEVQRALELRDVFISMAAHELRTPMTTILGYIEMIHKRFPKDKSSESRWIYELKRESSRLSDLVNELLQVSRVKAGKLSFNFAEHDIKTIIHKAMMNFQFTHSERKVVFEDRIDKQKTKIIGDFDKLLQVMTNLVDNAIKFSAHSKEVRIVLKEDKEDYCIQVIDQGRGIAPKDKEKIFEGYYRASNNEIEGMGLGLYLVKNIIDNHHGSISIQSKVGKGTTVEVKLPKRQD